MYFKQKCVDGILWWTNRLHVDELLVLCTFERRRAKWFRNIEAFFAIDDVIVREPNWFPACVLWLTLYFVLLKMNTWGWAGFLLLLFWINTDCRSIFYCKNGTHTKHRYHIMQWNSFECKSFRLKSSIWVRTGHGMIRKKDMPFVYLLMHE